jgi:hypothetical protein
VLSATAGAKNVASRQCPAWHLQAPTTWQKSPIVAAPRRYDLSLVAPVPPEVRDRAGLRVALDRDACQRCNTGDIGELSTIVRTSTDGAAARSRAAATNRSPHQRRPGSPIMPFGRGTPAVRPSDAPPRSRAGPTPFVSLQLRRLGQPGNGLAANGGQGAVSADRYTALARGSRMWSLRVELASLTSLKGPIRRRALDRRQHGDRRDRWSAFLRWQAPRASSSLGAPATIA